MSGVHNATNWLDNPFWQYSLTQYAKPGCAQFLLDAQDQKHLDVNILLFIGWISYQQLTLSQSSQLKSARLCNRLMIKPIRALRKVCKVVAPSVIYNRVKDIELKAEQIEQALLFAISRQLNASTNMADLCFEKNIECYTEGVQEGAWLQALKEYLQPV